jgi:hypothetical protein
VQLLLEMRFARGVAGVDVSFKCERPDLANFAFDAIGAALQ